MSEAVRRFLAFNGYGSAASTAMLVDLRTDLDTEVDRRGLHVERRLLEDHVLAASDLVIGIPVSAHASGALGLVDRWLNTQFSELADLIARRAQARGVRLKSVGRAFAGMHEDFPTPSALAHFSSDPGADLLKATLLLGLFSGELGKGSRPAVEFADDVRKVLTNSAWSDVLPLGAVDSDRSLSAVMSDVASTARASMTGRTWTRTRQVFLERAERIANACESARRFNVERAETAGGREQSSVVFLLGDPGEGEVRELKAHKLEDFALLGATDVPPRPPDSASDQAHARGADIAEAEDRIRFSLPDLGLDEPSSETSAGEQARRSRAAFRSARQNQVLPLVHEHLFPHEVEQLVASVLAALDGSDVAARRSAALVGLSLSVGMAIDELLETRIDPEFGSGLQIDGRWSHAAPREPNAVRPSILAAAIFLEPYVERMPLGLPAALGSFWRSVLLPVHVGRELASAFGLPATALAREARDWLEPQRRNGARLTIGRIGRHLRIAAYRRCHDHVLTRLTVSSRTEPACPAAYYRSVEARAVQDLHKHTLSDLWPVPIEPVAPCTGYTGSALRARHPWLSNTLSRLEMVLGERASDSARPLVERHNALQCLWQFELLLITGHRAVESPMESLGHLSADYAWAFFDDKVVAPTRSNRWIPLPALARRIITAQVEHLRRVRASVAHAHPELASRIDAILEHPASRCAPLFFLLNDEMRPIAITPTSLREEIGDLWQLPLNFGRHWLSSRLHDMGVSDESIAGLLGHVDIGTENLSVLSPRNAKTLFARLRVAQDELVETLGLSVLASFLPEVSASNAAALPRPEPMLFGGERRAADRRARAGRLQREVVEAVDRQRGERNVDELEQSDVDALFTWVRDPQRGLPRYEAFRQAEALRRHLLKEGGDSIRRWRMPAIATRLQDFGTTADVGALAGIPFVAGLRDSLRNARDRAVSEWDGKDTDAPFLAPGLMMLCVAVEGLVLDPAIWRRWLEHRDHRLYRTARNQFWIRFSLAENAWRDYPLPWWLGTALARVNASVLEGITVSTLASEARRHSPARLRHVGGAAGNDFFRLLSVVQAAVTVRAPGLVLGHLNGTLGSVSPAMSACERLHAGGMTRSTLNALRPPEEEPEEGTDDRRRPSVSTGVRDGGVDAFVDLVLRAFRVGLEGLPLSMDDEATQHPKSDGAKKEERARRRKARNRTRLDRFGAALAAGMEELRVGYRLPPIVNELADWLDALALGTKPDGENYAFKTVQNYWHAIALRLIEELGDVPILEMDTCAIEETYGAVIEFSETNDRQHLFVGLRNFHRFLRERRAMPDIEWSLLALLAGMGVRWVDANLITRQEYLAALKLLSEDKSADQRTRTLQSAVLVLIYRGGLRVNEALGLRRKDLDRRNGTWMIRVIGNLYREIKSDAGLRIVPVLEDLEALEERCLDAWVKHVDEYIDGRAVEALFTEEKSAALYPRWRIARRIRDALRAATGDPRVRIHHCRHAFATRILGAMLLDGDRDRFLSSLGVVDGLRPRLRDILTQETDVTRRALWAVAALMGHASPLTTCQVYFHSGHLVARSWIAESWWKPRDAIETADLRLIACTAGARLKTLQEARRASKSGPLTAAVLIDRYCGVDDLGDLKVLIPPGRLPLQAVSGDRPLDLELIDRAIDLARRGSRVDGIADALMLDEPRVQSIVMAAHAVADRVIDDPMPRAAWWLEPADTWFGVSERKQVEMALRRFRSIGPTMDKALDLWVEGYRTTRHQVVLSDASDVAPMADLYKSLVDDPTNVELALPLEEPSGGDARKGALNLAPWRAAANVAGISCGELRQMPIRPRGGKGVARRHERAVLRISGNASDVVRRNKVAARVVATLTVARVLNSSPEASGTRARTRKKPGL